MSDLNSCNFTGRIASEPILRETANGTPVLEFRLAVNGGRRDPETGEWVEVANFLSVVLFGTRAEKLAGILSKGRLVAVSAEARFSTWEKDDERRSKVDFIARSIDLLGPKPKDAGESGAEPAEDIASEDIPF